LICFLLRAMVNSSSNLIKSEPNFWINSFCFLFGFFFLSAQLVNCVWAFFIVNAIFFTPVLSNIASFLPSVINDIWFLRSFKLLFTGVAESIRTFVFTPLLIIFSINHLARFMRVVPSSLIFSIGLPLKLWLSSITTKS